MVNIINNKSTENELGSNEKHFVTASSLDLDLSSNFESLYFNSYHNTKSDTKLLFDPKTSNIIPNNSNISKYNSKLTINIPYKWVGVKYNHIKSHLIKGCNIFLFEMRKDSLKISIDLYCLDVEKTLEFLCSAFDLIFYNSDNLICNIGEEKSYFNKYCNDSTGYIIAEPLKFSYLNFLLSKVLQIDEYSKILKLYNCKLGHKSSGSTVSVIVYGVNREMVNKCKRGIEEIYYSCALAEMIGNNQSVNINNFDNMTANNDSNKPSNNKANAFVEIYHFKDNQPAFTKNGENSQIFKKIIFGNSYELFKNHGIQQECVIYLLANFDAGNFICGKKMGKIHKIGCPYLNVHLLDGFIKESTEIYFSFKIQGPFKECMECYNNLFDEFPFEMCFNIDRRHHKKIIGIEGTVIQKIMRKYNFYVKFLNAKEVNLLKLEGNVILKTPRKNKIILEDAKNEILKYVNEENISSKKDNQEIPKDKDSKEFNGINIMIEPDSTFEVIKKFVEMSIQKEKWY